MFSSNIQNISNLYQLSQNGQVRVPVDPNEVMFSNFSHINGVAAAGSTGPSASELHTINQLIERLYRQQELKQASRAADLRPDQEIVQNQGTILDIEI